MPWETLAKVVQEGRLRHEWGKEEAARRAGISSITWKRIEDGLPVQTEKLAAALRAIGLQANLPGTQEGEVITLGIGDWADFHAGVEEGRLTVGGDSKDDQYVESSTGERVEAGVTDNEVLREIREMRAAIEELRERMDRREQGS